jgi:hypothetical protein
MFYVSTSKSLYSKQQVHDQLVSGLTSLNLALTSPRPPGHSKLSDQTVLFGLECSNKDSRSCRLAVA